jgi:hypothetical protein
MASSLHLSREVKAYVNIGSDFWEIPVLDGMSFSQSTNVDEITIAEMVDISGNSRRGRLGFNDSLNAAEWSFDTYAQPFISASAGHSAAEEVLWALMAGYKGTYTAQSEPSKTGTFSDVISKSSNSMQVDFNSSNVLEFQTATIYFKFPANGAAGTDLVYAIRGAAVNECTADFDLDGVTTLNWSGFGTLIEDVSASSALTTSFGNAVTEGLDQTGTFIRNRLTQLTLTPKVGSSTSAIAAASYGLVLTGGSISIANNIEYITPESLNVVNRPLGSVNGTRTVTGSFTCYVDNDTDKSAELFEDLINASTEVKNEFDLTFKVGGTATPRVEFNFPQAMLEIPAHSVEDVVSLEVNFHGLPSDISATDEMTIVYVGEALA